MRLLQQLGPAWYRLCHRWRRYLRFSALALALGGSSVALAHSFEEMLEMPIECLLQLRISVRVPADSFASAPANLYAEQKF